MKGSSLVTASFGTALDGFNSMLHGSETCVPHFIRICLISDYNVFGNGGKNVSSSGS
jgi:hypothetical protein